VLGNIELRLDATQAPAVSYRIPVVGTGYRFAAGHRLRLVLAGDDQDPNFRP
jgi:predicted acyl esterase